MSHYQPESWTSLNRFVAGRRAYALRKIQIALIALGYADLAARCEPLIEAELVQIERLRLFKLGKSAATAAAWTPEIIAADVLLDRLLGDLRELLDALARRTGTPRGDAAKTLNGAALSEGLAYYTQQNFGIEEVRVASLLAVLARHANEVALTTTDDIVADLIVAHRNYQALIVAHTKANRPDWDSVKAGDLANQRQFIELIFAIFSRTGDLPEAERLAARERILAPVVEHDQAISAQISARRAIKDVNPETGEPEA